MELLEAAIQVGIGFDDVQMSVLRFRVVRIKLREPHVSYWLPVTCGSLDIAIILAVEGVFLNTLIEFNSIIERLMVACRTGILRHSVDGEADSIELLLRVEWLSLIVHTPKDATILLVNEVVNNILLGPCSSLQIFWIAQHTIGCRERPQDTSIQDGAFLCLGMQFLTAINTTIEAPVLTILHLVEPEAQDILLKNILHFPTHSHIITHYLGFFYETLLFYITILLQLLVDLLDSSCS